MSKHFWKHPKIDFHFVFFSHCFARYLCPVALLQFLFVWFPETWQSIQDQLWICPGLPGESRYHGHVMGRFLSWLCADFRVHWRSVIECSFSNCVGSLLAFPSVVHDPLSPGSEFSKNKNLIQLRKWKCYEWRQHYIKNRLNLSLFSIFPQSLAISSRSSKQLNVEIADIKIRPDAAIKYWCCCDRM